MRILLLTQFFTPEIGATQTRLHTFAAGLASHGHDVEVVCGVPNHPHGVVHPGYRRTVARRVRMDGFEVTHVWVRTRPAKTTRDRMIYYASYAGLAVAVGSARPRPDVIVASSPPLPVAAAGAALARRHRVPWVMDVRDLWPAAAVAMGELGPGRALTIASQLERYLYESASAITVVTRPFVENVASVADSARGKITLVPNGTSEAWLAGADSVPDRAALGLSSDEFIWTFAGNIGTAQGLDAAIGAAGRLGRGYRLLVLGNGPARADLEALAARTAGATVEFRDQVPPEEARRYLHSSDALLVSLAADPIFQDFVPSKLFDFCATGVPVICAAAGEPQRLAEAAGAALPVAPGDAPALANAVTRIQRGADPVVKGLGRAGREFAKENLRARHTQTLEQVLEEVARG